MEQTAGLFSGCASLRRLHGAAGHVSRATSPAFQRLAFFFFFLPPFFLGALFFRACANFAGQGVDTGAGMVVLDPPVTVANIIPGSANDFFLRKRIDEVRTGDF